jgi:hypothetical protein
MAVTISTVYEQVVASFGCGSASLRQSVVKTLSVQSVQIRGQKTYPSNPWPSFICVHLWLRTRRKRKNLRLRFRHQDRMFEVGGQAPISSDRSPSILKNTDP